MSDLMQSVRFYAEAFGWSTVVDTPVYVEFLLPGDQRLGLYERRAFALNTGLAPTGIQHGQLSGTELYFYTHGTDDLLVSIRRLEAVNAQLLSRLQLRSWGDDAAYFADPDGNVIVLARTR
jgi:catechol 2,3-dioxygenase-like lactoylglutathione lyase family enzyme